MDRIPKFASDIHRPDKEQVRAWLQRRHGTHEPLPDITQIRRALDWRSMPRPDGAVPVADY